MKPYLKLNSFSVFFEKSKKTFLVLKNFFKNIKDCYLVMPRWEKLIFFAFLIASLSLLSVKAYQFYLANTVLVAANGGKYTEIVVGETKTINPVLVQTDAGRSASALIFSGLVKITGQNTVIPSVAEGWEVSEDGLSYTFHLRKDIKFNDDTALTANDVIYTLGLIQDQSYKSPLYQSWADIGVEAIDNYTIKFTLPTAYGPFIYNCNFGIMPSHISADEFNKKAVGSGQFQVVNVITDGNKISQIDLKKNEKYFDQKPYLNEISLIFISDKKEAITKFESDDKVLGLFGTSSDLGKSFSFNSARQLGLIFNLKDEFLSQKENRDKILSGGMFETKQEFKLVALDAPSQVEKAAKLKEDFLKQNIDLKINLLSNIKFQEALERRDYQLLLNGFNFSYDSDPYIFWHSSQVSKLNFSSFTDKEMDIMLEDARMTIDGSQRNQLYSQISNKIEENSLAKFYDPLKFEYFVKGSLKGIGQIDGVETFSRYDKIDQWFLKEKRVRR